MTASFTPTMAAKKRRTCSSEDGEEIKPKVKMKMLKKNDNRIECRRQPKLELLLSETNGSRVENDVYGKCFKL